MRTTVTKAELDRRVKQAYELRYNQGYSQAEYVKWAKEEYGDKSEQQYCQYFLKARQFNDQVWKDLLERQLEPAVHEIIKLMADEDPKVRQRAIDQVFKYTGNDIQKIDASVAGAMDIKVSFGSDEE